MKLKMHTETRGRDIKSTTPRNKILHCRATAETIANIETIRKAAGLSSQADTIEFMALQGEPQAKKFLAQELKNNRENLSYNDLTRKEKKTFMAGKASFNEIVDGRNINYPHKQLELPIAPVKKQKGS